VENQFFLRDDPAQQLPPVHRSEKSSRSYHARVERFLPRTPGTPRRPLWPISCEDAGTV
jgi:hypothetical protein